MSTSPVHPSIPVATHAAVPTPVTHPAPTPAVALPTVATIVASLTSVFNAEMTPGLRNFSGDRSFFDTAHMLLGQAAYHMVVGNPDFYDAMAFDPGTLVPRIMANAPFEADAAATKLMNDAFAIYIAYVKQVLASPSPNTYVLIAPVLTALSGLCLTAETPV